VEAGFDTGSGGDVPDWDNTESRKRDEDAAWRDLVARFDAPLTEQEPAPWPEREDMHPRDPGAGGLSGGPGNDGDPERAVEGDRGSRRADGWRTADRRRGTDGTRGTDGIRGADGLREADEARGADGLREADGIRGADGVRETDGVHEVDGLRETDGLREADGVRGVDGLYGGLEGFGTGGTQAAFGADEMPEAQDPDVIQAPRRIWGPGARRLPGRGLPGRGLPASGTPAGGTAGLGTRGAGVPADDDDDHFIPPAPPPLPRLDPLAKGAWAALFGGPGYLIVATAAGWSVSGLAAFCAVAAFVAGFAILVLRMNDPGPGGPDDGDDGAVV
jgi:hypothetical protein